MRVLAGRNAHHVVEAQFKAVARALRDAVALDRAGRRHPEHEGHLVVMGLLLLILGGFLLGGAYSFARQRKSWVIVAILGVAAVLALIGAALRL